MLWIVSNFLDIILSYFYGSFCTFWFVRTVNDTVGYKAGCSAVVGAGFRAGAGGVRAAMTLEYINRWSVNVSLLVIFRIYH